MTNATSSLQRHKTRQLDVGSLIAGLLFLALGIAFVFEAADQWTFELGHVRFVGPLVLIVIGIATLIGASMAQRNRPQATMDDSQQPNAIPKESHDQTGIPINSGRH